MDVKHGLEQILDNLILILLPRGPDLVDLALGIPARFFLGLFVPLGVLYPHQ